MTMFRLARRMISKHRAWSAATAVLYSIAVLMLVACFNTIYYLITDIISLEQTYQNEYSLYVNDIVYIISIWALSAALAFSLIYGIILLTAYCFEKTSELFRLCGITSDMMFSFLAYIGALLCIPGMILGLAAEVVSCVLIGSSVNCGYSLYLYAAVSYIVVILLVIFGAALACRNKISSHDKYSSFVKTRLKLRFRNPVLLLGIKGFIVNRQSYAVFITIAMISVSLSCFISNFFLANTEQPDFFDICINSYDTELAGERGALTDPFYGISGEDIVSLSQTDGVEQVISEKSILAYIVPDNLSHDNIDEFGFSANDKLDSINLTSVYGIDYSELEPYLASGAIDAEKLQSGAEVIYCDNGEAQFHTGDAVDFAVLYYNETGEPQRADLSSTVGAVMNVPTDYGTYLFGLQYSILLSDRTMSELLPESNYNSTYIQLKDISYSNSVNDRLYSIKSKLADKSGVFLERFWQQEAQMTRDFRAITETIGWVFNAVLTLISLVYMSSFMITRFDKSAGNIYTQQAIGMSRSQILGVFLLENALNSVWAFLTGAAAGVLYGVISSWCFGDNVMYMVPWSGMLIFAGVMMFATIFVTSGIYILY